jgi:hypothetical protein
LNVGTIPEGHIFNGNTQGIGNIVTNTSNITALNAFTIDYRLGGTSIGNGILPTNAGTYTVFAVFESTENINAANIEIGEYTIARRDITGFTVGTFGALTYNGAAQTPSAAVTLASPVLTATGNWSQVTNVGQNTTFTADGNFIGTFARDPGMTPLDVGTSPLVLTFNTMNYTGSPQTPSTSAFLVNSVSVTGGSWSSVTNVSDTTTFTPTGGNYTGTLANRVTGMNRISRPSAPYNLSADVRADIVTTGREITLPELPLGATYPSSGVLGGTTGLISSQSITGNTLIINTADYAVNTSATITITVTYH